MRRIHTFILFSCLNLVAHAAVYTDATRRFRFEYDETLWELVKTPSAAKPQADVDKAMAERTLVTIQKKQADDKYHPRFNVVLDSAERFKGTSAERFVAYHNHALKFLKEQQFQVASSGTTKLPQVNEPAFEIIASQRNFGLTVQQVVFLKGGDAYLLTASARISKFEEHKKDLKRFFDSFQFTVQN